MCTTHGAPYRARGSGSRRSVTQSEHPVRAAVHIDSLRKRAASVVDALSDTAAARSMRSCDRSDVMTGRGQSVRARAAAHVPFEWSPTIHPLSAPSYRASGLDAEGALHVLRRRSDCRKARSREGNVAYPGARRAPVLPHVEHRCDVSRLVCRLDATSRDTHTRPPLGAVRLRRHPQVMAFEVHERASTRHGQDRYRKHHGCHQRCTKWRSEGPAPRPSLTEMDSNGRKKLQRCASKKTSGLK